ncbi:MAG: cytochrome c [Acidobacteria bacterium]|nr:cytochrome c [Acidobacteriota bacterium]
MRCSLNLLVPLVALAPWVAALAQAPTYNRGRTPSQEEIRAWDIAIGPEGKELPPGSGTAKEGAKIYAQQCAHCHGPTGREAPFLPGAAADLWPYSSKRPAPPLVGRYAETTYKKVLLGSRLIADWQLATMIWDYTNRAMPPGGEGSLSADEVYALTALMLYWNGIIQESDIMDAKSLSKIQMPSRKK